MKIILFADDNVSRAKGLMGHRPLQKDECAYFYFPNDSIPLFWNKNVDFPISLIFVNKNGVVKDIRYLNPHQLSGVRPSSRIRHVIEAHKDAPKIYKIKVGSYLDFDENKNRFEVNNGRAKI